MRIMDLTRHNALRASVPLIQPWGYLLGGGDPCSWLSVALRVPGDPTGAPLPPHGAPAAQLLAPTAARSLLLSRLSGAEPWPLR